MVHPYIPEQEINDLYNHIFSDEFQNKVIKLDNFVANEPEVIQNLTIEINQLSSDVNLINNRLSTLLETMTKLWEKKKAIMTTFTNGNPDYTGEYSGLTNADFARGSVCFILKQ